MSLYRYSRWDGSQQLPPFDADDVLDALADDVLAEGDVRRALQRLMQRGLRGTRGGDVPGLRRIVDRLRERRRRSWSRAHLDGVLDELAERVAGDRGSRSARGSSAACHDAERDALDAAPGRAQDQARMAEQVLRGRPSSDATGSTHCRRTWPGGCTRCATTSSWTPMRATPSTPHRRAAPAAAGDLLPGAEGRASRASHRRTWTGCATWCATSTRSSRSTPPASDTRADFDELHGPPRPVLPAGHRATSTS